MVGVECSRSLRSQLDLLPLPVTAFLEIDHPPPPNDEIIEPFLALSATGR